MPRPALKPAVLALIQDLASMPEMVASAKLSPMDAAMTQNGYASYASRIDSISRTLAQAGEPTNNHKIIAAEVLREAGGNGTGIDAAMHAVFGIDGYATF